MKLKTKLLLGLFTLPILIILPIIIGSLQVASLHKISGLIQTNYDTYYLTEQIYINVKDEAISLRNIILYEDENLTEKEFSTLKMKSEAVSQHIALLELQPNTSAQQKIMINDLKNTNEKFNEYKEKLIQLNAEGKKEEAIQLISSTGHPLQEEFFETVSLISTSFGENLKSSLTQIPKDFQQDIILGSLFSLCGLIIVSIVLFRNTFNLTNRLYKVSNVMLNVASGSSDLNTRVEVKANDEIDTVANSFNKMVQTLDEQIKKEQNILWVKSNIAEVTTSLSGTHNLESLSKTFLSKVVPLMDSCHAVIYMKDVEGQQNDNVFKLLASYAFKERKHLSNTFREGEGIIGQAILEKTPIILTNVPTDYIRVKSGLGEGAPLNLYVLPIIFEDDVKAVLEIASFNSFNETQQSLLEELINGLGIILDNVIGRNQLAKLLEESQTLMEEVQAQAEELQSQQEELRVTNEELEEQTVALRQSEEKLQIQQEELEQTNINLQEKAINLEEQNQKFEIINKEIENARAELEEKAKQLTLNSKYKSEFLANMSHELRTPLNSLLILSKLLSENQGGNLTKKQIEYSKIIYSSGNDLLTLINEILDLSKIEAGKVDINPTEVLIEDIVDFVEKSFRPIANEKGLDFTINLKGNLPNTIYIDKQRLEQILKNLLSNAFKFTKEGNVTLEIGYSSKFTNQSAYSFSIVDTGIGIPQDKLELIFQAFQQADGTTSRKYGGTGLGLSISRQISVLLGGEITVESEEGKGSIFTFNVNENKGKVEVIDSIISSSEVAVTKEVLVNKEAGTTKILPLDLIQTKKEDKNSSIKRILIVDDDITQRNSLMELIGEKEVVITAVSTGFEALEELKVSEYDFMVLDLGLSDTSGFDLIKKIQIYVEKYNLKVFIYTGRDLTSKEELFLNQYSHTIIIKEEHSPQRLLDEIEFYLNSNTEQFDNDYLDEIKDEKLFSDLEGKEILLVDDDIRNVYALSNALELYGMNITFAENGEEGLGILENNSGFDLVLMDIMMPEMDGYEMIQRIRANPKFSNLPVIALTAKAMKEDREKCMEAGASDYITKPFELEQLISLIRVWLYAPNEKKY